MPSIHPEDMVYVTNINLGDMSKTSEVVQVPVTVKDENGKDMYTHYERQIKEWSMDRGFRVGWGGRYQVVKPGETRIMPRYLADKFTKDLVDYMLGREMRETGDKNLMTNQARRLALESRIQEKGVYQFFHQEEDIDDVTVAFNRIDHVNRSDTSLEEIDMDDDRREEQVHAEPVSAKKQKSTKDDLTIEEVRKAATDMDIEFTDSDTKEQILEKLNSFA